MSNLHRHALVARLVDEMRAKESWAGRTHIQKSLYMFQELFHPGDRWEFKYLLYKHGPYSFELDEELAQMEFYGGLQREEQRTYGARYRTPENATHTLVSRYGEGVERWDAQLRFIAERVGTLTVRELEALCTLIWVTSESHEVKPDPFKAMARVKELKPHLSDIELDKAHERMAALRQEAGPLQQDAAVA